ncbi:MAG: sigma 54-interacting transcriptional regulator [Desulfoprunum sp.]|uniref:sigma-54 interaction domain-containing protein n=1 Tax=Desulfoprunum sp. TaxID=2020866 RepID=UPI003C74192C
MMKKTFAIPGEIVLDDLLAGFPHASAVLDEGFRIVTLNRLFEALTGYGHDIAVGVYADFILRSNMGNSRGQVFQRVLEAGEPATIDGDIINRSRKRIPVRFTVAPLHTRKGAHIRGLLLVAEDISAIHATGQTTLYRDWSTDIIGHSPKMQAVFEIMPLMARTDASILITGETGTGKDKIAETIHRNSPRGKFQFIKINCGALPPDLLESELFGHVKGAFTGAVRDKLGMFKLADRGTIFLTEIGDMPLSLQVKLLSVLDDRAFYPVGGERKEKVDVRVIAATHRSLREQVESGAFREDLFYRLNVLHIHLPPLREREGDIRFLLDYFLKDYATRLGKEVQSFSDTALRLLLNYQYPGNIRELRNIVEYCANVCRETTIDKDDLPRYLFDQGRENHAAVVPMAAARTEERAETRTGTPSASKVSGDNWPAVERELILQTLRTTRGNRSKAAELLGWGRTTLWRKIVQYGLG